MKAIYAALFFSIIFISCNKDYGTTTVEGKVIDVTTGKPVPYAIVTLGSREKGSWSAGYAPKEEYQANENGYFKFSFEAESVASYGLNAGYKKLYYGADSHVLIEGGRKNKNIEVKIQPIGWLKFHLHDEVPVGNVESFLVQPFNFPSSVRINRPSIDTSFKVMTFGNIDKQFFYFLTIDGIDQTFEGKIYTKALDTTDVYINF